MQSIEQINLPSDMLIGFLGLMQLNVITGNPIKKQNIVAQPKIIIIMYRYPTSHHHLVYETTF